MIGAVGSGFFLGLSSVVLACGERFQWRDMLVVRGAVVVWSLWGDGGGDVSVGGASFGAVL